MTLIILWICSTERQRFYGIFSMVHFQELYLIKTSCSVPCLRDVKSWEKKKKNPHCWKSSFTPVKIKQQYIKCLNSESSRQILLLCPPVLSRFSVSYSYYPNSRKPCLRVQRLFLPLACHWAWGWAKSCWKYRGLCIFLFSLKPIFLQGWWTVTWIKAACPKSVFITTQQSLCIFFPSPWTVL